MKELWAYQQSEAYKVCTEKIQENKIKKGEGPGHGDAGRGDAGRQRKPAWSIE